MKISWSTNGWEDYLFWQENDKKIAKRINILVKDIIRNPNDNHGIGKPEALKHTLSGYYSRRITDEHRLVYSVTDDELYIIQCRHHY
jgi:toxin YoeB